MGLEPLRAVRDHLSELVDRVEKQHERVTISCASSADRDVYRSP
jgi:hypothetical protein